MESRTKEYETHLNAVRMERDTLHTELDNIEHWLKAVCDAFDMDIPSVTKQSPWPCGIIDFGKAFRYGIDYFNPGLVRRPDGLWLVVRRSKFMPNFTYGMNDLLAFHMGADHKPTMGVKIQLPPMLNNEHFEDPRAVYYKGDTWVSCCNFVVYPHQTVQKWTGAHQILCKVNESWNSTKRYDPVFGKNGGSTSLNSGDEKNWTWFFHNDLPHMVYLMQPHTVVPFNAFFEAGKPYITEDINPLWMHGLPRGGSPPVLVDDEYWSFFHSSTPWIGKKRRYHMGVYAFEAKPPFRITRMSSLPLLSGSKEDKWQEGKPLVVFPGGAVLEDGKWLVVFGVNDMVSGWIEIPHADLRQIVRLVKPKMEAAKAEEEGMVVSG